MKTVSHQPPLRGRTAPPPPAAAPRDVLIGRPYLISEPPSRFWDEARVEAQAQELQRLRDEIASLPDIRPSLVTGLRQEIASGAHSIDAAKIADELLHEFRGDRNR